MIKYLKYSKAFNILPATMMGVWKQIIKQMLATLPIVFGLAFFMMSFFGSQSNRFMTFERSCIMIWSVWQSDELQNIYQNLIHINFLYGALFCYLWTFFVANIIHNVFLAMIEDGYTAQTQKEAFDWLNDELADPADFNIEDLDQEQEQQTAEELLQQFKKKQFIASTWLYDNERYKYKKAQINEILTLEQNEVDRQKITSKRALQTMLRHDELQFSEQKQIEQQRKMISGLISRLVVAKLDFNKMHNTELNSSITQIFDIGFKYTNQIDEVQVKNIDTFLDNDKTKNKFSDEMHLTKGEHIKLHVDIKGAIENSMKYQRRAKRQLKEIVKLAEDFERELDQDENTMNEYFLN